MYSVYHIKGRTISVVSAVALVCISLFSCTTGRNDSATTTTAAPITGDAEEEKVEIHPNSTPDPKAAAEWDQRQAVGSTSAPLSPSTAPPVVDTEEAQPLGFTAPRSISGAAPTTSKGAMARGQAGRKAGRTAPEPQRRGYARSVDSSAIPEQGGSDTYDRIVENSFLASSDNPLSTFSIDVDAASYSNVRRYVKGGQLPPTDAVRIEELINYFHYDYPQPEGAHPFSITTESAVAPWAPQHQLVSIGLQGRTFDMEELPANNLVFLIDVSGSMESPDKLPLLQSSLRLLVGQLREKDMVSIVVYAGNAGMVLPPTSGADRTRIIEAIDNLRAGGSTAGGAGIQLAYATAAANYVKTGNNRVILATDGDFNVGVSSDAELVRLIEEKRNSGVYLTVLGFGRGNLKDSRMEQMADKGNGHYAYIDGIAEARKVFGNEIGATLFTIAKDVKIQVEFNPAKVAGYRLIGYENRALRSEDFNDDRKDAGDLGAGHTVTALYEIIPAGAPLSDIRFTPVDSLKYQTTRVSPTAHGSDEIMTVKLRYKHPNDTASKLIVQPVKEGRRAFADASENLRFAAAVAGWGMLLRGSEHKGSASYEQMAKIARGAIGNDKLGYRTEFVTLVESSAGLSTTASR